MSSVGLAFGTTLIAAAVSALAAVLAFMTSRKASEDQSKNLEVQFQHQREIAVNERLWQERRVVYVDLLVWLQDLTDPPPDEEEEFNKFWERGRVVWAKVAAFGTPHILKLYDETEKAMRAWRDARKQDDEQEWNAASDAGWAALRRLADAIRADFGDPTHRDGPAACA